MTIQVTLDQTHQEIAPLDHSLPSIQNEILEKIYDPKESANLFAPLSLDQLMGLLYPAFDKPDQNVILRNFYGTLNRDSVIRYLKSAHEKKEGFVIGNCVVSNISTEALETHFDELHAKRLDLDDENVVEKINQHIYEQTSGLIPRLIESKGDLPQEGVVAINAGSFVGKFDQQFDPDNTIERPFFSGEQVEKQLPTMWGFKKARYYETSSYQYVELTLERGAYTLAICLPKEGIAMADLIKANPFMQARVYAKRSFTEIYLPKFQATQSKDLKAILVDLGIPLDQQTQIGTIGGILQKTYFELEEGGLKSAFVTSNICTANLDDRLPYEVINCNRPFAFKLIDDRGLDIMDGIFNG
jgi:hypothetical protein